MDQPGNSHFSLGMGQQTLNGHGGYYGRGYEGSARKGGAHKSGSSNAADTSADEIVHDAAVPDDPQDPTDQDASGLASEGTSDTPGEEDTTDGEQAAGANGTSAADRMRELLARSTVDHAATERAMAVALDGIQQRLADLEHAVAEIGELAEAERDTADRVAEQLGPQAQRLAGMSATLDGLTASLSTLRAQVSAIDGRLADADSRLAGTEVQLASTEGRVTALDTRFERLDERLDDQYDRVTSIDARLADADGRIIALGGQLTDAIAPVAEELRARPDRAEVEEVVAKIVEAAHTDLSSRLTSLEDTVLTLAEALLRPAPGHAPTVP